MKKPPLWPVLFAAVALLALTAFLGYLTADSWAQLSDCEDADVLGGSECGRLFDTPGLLFLIGAIASAAVAVLLTVVTLLVRRRSSEPEAERDTEVPPDQGEAPVRVCRVCSAQSKTHSDRCPHCGSSFIRSRGVRVKRGFGGLSAPAKALVFVAVLMVPLAAAGAAGAAYLSSSKVDEAEELTDSELLAQEVEEERREAAAAKREEAAERSVRQSLVRDLEKSITDDAQEDAEGQFAIIDGPVLETQCDPSGGVIETEATTQRFNCLAVTDYTGAGGVSGYRYSAEVNFRSFSYRWRFGGGGV